MCPTRNIDVGPWQFRLAYDIEAVMVAVVPSLLGQPHHFTQSSLESCQHWQAKCRYIGEALPFAGTISTMHQLCVTCNALNDTFPIGHREEVLLD